MHVHSVVRTVRYFVDSYSRRFIRRPPYTLHGAADYPVRDMYRAVRQYENKPRLALKLKHKRRVSAACERVRSSRSGNKFCHVADAMLAGGANNQKTLRFVTGRGRYSACKTGVFRFVVL